MIISQCPSLYAVVRRTRSDYVDLGLVVAWQVKIVQGDEELEPLVWIDGDGMNYSLEHEIEAIKTNYGEARDYAAMMIEEKHVKDLGAGWQTSEYR